MNSIAAASGRSSSSCCCCPPGTASTSGRPPLPLGPRSRRRGGGVLRPQAVLQAPPSTRRQPGSRAATTTTTAPPPPTSQPQVPADGGVWAAASALVSGLRQWRVPDASLAAPDASAGQQQPLALLAPSQDAGQAVTPASLDITAFLAQPSDQELRHARMLAHLCAQTYFMGQLTPAKLRRWHNLELVTSSLCCERIVYEHRRTEHEVLLEADGMAGPCLYDALERYRCAADDDAEGCDVEASSSSSSSSSSAALPPSAAGPALLPPPIAAAATAAIGANNVVPFGADGSSSAAAAVAALSAAAAQQAAGGAQQPQASSSSSSSATSSSWSPADIVAAKLSEAAAAASAATLQPLASAAGSLYAGSLSLASSVSSSVASAAAAAGAAPAAALGAAAAAAAAAGVNVGAVAAVATGNGGSGSGATDRLLREAVGRIASAEIAASHPNPRDVKAASTSSGSRCPSEWFVGDDAAARVRYFTIQGSDSLDHWRTNLMFEPVPFEAQHGLQGLGVRVHRGAYEAAVALYDRFLPLVQEHLDSAPDARVCFTGHSIGGSLAVLLVLMLRQRGAVQPHQLAPCYTFGAPAVFCDAAAGPMGACGACDAGDDAPQQQQGGGAAACELTNSSSAANGGGDAASLLAQLGLGEDAVRAVVMTRDIVPRAFSCDYSLVAELLRSWGPSWREHSCLSGGATGAGRRQLYVHLGRTLVLQPSRALRFVTEPQHYLPMLPQRGGVFELLPRPTLAGAMAAARARARAVRGGGGGGNSHHDRHHHGDDAAPPANAATAGRAARSRAEALAAIMDCPHPLETLADPGAYGTNGSISRYHNPEHYFRALGRALAERRDAAADALAAPSAVPRRAAAHRPFFPPLPAAATAAAAAGQAGSSN